MTNDDEDPQPCPACGEVHERTLAERYFIDECEHRGLSTDGEVVPPKARMVVVMSSAVLAPLHAMVEDDPAALVYYSAALAALSRMAEDIAEDMVKAAAGGEVPDTVPDGWGSV